MGSGLSVSALRFYDGAGTLVPPSPRSPGPYATPRPSGRCSTGTLLQALDAGGPGRLVLELDGPIHPLRLHAGDDRMSMLMPLRR